MFGTAGRGNGRRSAQPRPRVPALRSGGAAYAFARQAVRYVRCAVASRYRSYASRRATQSAGVCGVWKVAWLRCRMLRLRMCMVNIWYGSGGRYSVVFLPGNTVQACYNVPVISRP